MPEHRRLAHIPSREHYDPKSEGHGAQAPAWVRKQLAELAARSQGRLIVVGILHQAFEEYAHRLARDQRDEWAKVQGRFIDLAVNAAGEEQLEVLARAI
jgi:hypothetical protein